MLVINNKVWIIFILNKKIYLIFLLLKKNMYLCCSYVIYIITCNSVCNSSIYRKIGEVKFLKLLIWQRIYDEDEII